MGHRLPPAASFFVTGGTLHPDAPSYVERRADGELLDSLLRGEFCYVLTARQMGKSSLMVRTSQRLRQSGRCVVVLDITALGQNLTPEQWYRSLLALVGEQLHLDAELEAAWRELAHLGPARRWMAILTGTVLPHCPRGLVVFVDEIDAVLSLPFSTDELFAGIRACYNERAAKPDLERLAFCLLGVAAPSDLIRNPAHTPFNIGRRVELDDFTAEEAAPLATGLGRTSPGPTPAAQRLLGRVLYWTGGHPYLTQRLCRAVAERRPRSDACGAVRVDRACAELFFCAGAEQREDNLLFVRERLLRAEGETAALLDLYGAIRRGRMVPDDPTSRLVSVLRLAGIVRGVGGRLRVRNRIYGRVFTPGWVAAHMPDAELRRQRSAFWRGVRRTIVASAVLIGIVGAMAAVALQQRQEARQSAAVAREQTRLANRRLTRLILSEGERRTAEGDIAAALPWYVEALRLDLGNPEREAIHRLRIGAHLDTLPRLLRSYTYPGGLFAVVSGFGPNMKAADINADGSLVVTAGVSTPQVWDVPSGEPLTRRGLPVFTIGHTEAVAFSPDDETIVTLGATNGSDSDEPRIVRFERPGEPLNQVVGAALWRRSGALLWKRQGPVLLHRRRVILARFSPDGRKLVTGGEEGAVRVWSTTTGLPLTGWLGHEGGVAQAAFSPDSSRVAVVGGAANGWGAGTIWAVDQGRVIGRLPRQAKPLTRVEWSPGGRSIATVAADSTVRIWDASTTHPLSQPLRHSGEVLELSFSPTGQWLVSGDAHGAARVWDSLSGRPIAGPLLHEGAVFSVAFSPDARSLAVGTRTGVVSVWRLPTGTKVSPPLKHAGSVVRIRFLDGGRRLFTAGADGTWRIWSLSGAPNSLRMPHRATILDARYSPDNSQLAALAAGGRVRVWSSRTGRMVAEVGAGGSQARRLAYDADGTRLVIAGGDGTARVCTVGSATTARTIVRHRLPLVTARWSSDSRWIVTVDSRGEVSVWDSTSGRAGTPLRRQAYLYPRNRVVDAWFSGTDKVVATDSRGSHFSWNAVTGERTDASEGYMAENARLAAVFSESSRTSSGAVEAWLHPDRRRVLVVGGNTARVWDGETLQPVSASMKHRGPIKRASFSPDGRLVITAEGRTTRIWDAHTGEPVTPPLPHPAPITVAGFSPDGSRVFSGCADGTVRLQWLRPESQGVAALDLLAQLLSGYRINASEAVPASITTASAQLFPQPWTFDRLTKGRDPGMGWTWSVVAMPGEPLVIGRGASGPD